MPTNTTRLALSNPIGTDSPSQIRVSTTANNAKLDNTALYTEGTLLSRPAVGAVEHGHVYYATDTRVFSRNDGTTWWGIDGRNVVNPATGTLTNNESAVVAPGVTVTLPTPTQNGWVSITASGSVTSASPVTVNGTNIFGVGLSAASTFLLGTPLASVTLTSDGANWIMITGQQDTGWLALSLITNVVTLAGAYTPSARLRGDVVQLSGTMQNNTGLTQGGTSATIPVGLRPASSVAAPAVNASGAVVASLFIFSSGNLQVQNFANANTVGLDHVQFRLS